MPFNLFEENDRKPFNPFYSARSEPIPGPEAKQQFDQNQKGKNS
jgi:hypothetical protein